MDNKIPIWISDWVIGYIGGKGKKVDHYIVKGVIVEGHDEDRLLQDKRALRKALWVHEQGKKSSKVSRKQIDDVADKYIAVSVQLIRNVGYGVAE